MLFRVGTIKLTMSWIIFWRGGLIIMKLQIHKYIFKLIVFFLNWTKGIISFHEKELLPIVYLSISHFLTGQIGLSVLIESTDRKSYHIYNTTSGRTVYVCTGTERGIHNLGWHWNVNFSFLFRSFSIVTIYYEIETLENKDY